MKHPNRHYEDKLKELQEFPTNFAGSYRDNAAPVVVRSNPRFQRFIAETKRLWFRVALPTWWIVGLSVEAFCMIGINWDSNNTHWLNVKSAQEQHFKDWENTLNIRQAAIDEKEKAILLKEQEEALREKVRTLSLEELQRRAAGK